LNDRYLPHLKIEKFALPAGGEWRPPIRGWWLVHIHSGCGYGLSSEANGQLERGTALRFSPQWSGRLRASQISALHLNAVHVDPFRLPGLVTLSEEQFFRRAQGKPELSFRAFAPSHRLAHEADALFHSGDANLSFRLQALHLFLQTFEQPVGQSPARSLEKKIDAADRLREILCELPSADLVHLEINQLVTRVHCTPRHFSRLFRELVGVSFREKQTQVRLDRAVQLLARGNYKVVDIAFESGFESVSLFNALFKRRFRVAPGQWRKKAQTRAALATADTPVFG
jgi:AraC-like DNA-binding protein